MRARAKFAFFIAAIVWGASFAFQRQLLAVISPYTFLFWNFASGLFFLVLSLGQKARLLYRLREGVCLGLLLAGIEIFQTVGLKVTTAAQTAFISNVGMLLVPYAGWLIYKHRVTPSNNLALLAAAYGMYLLVGGVRGFDWGVLLLVISAVFMALYFLYLERFGAERRSHIVPLITQQFLVTAAVCAGALFLFDLPFAIPGDLTTAVLWQTLAFTTFPYAIVQWAGKWADEIIAAFYDGVVEPLVGGIVSWVFFFEPVTRTSVGGGIIMVIAFGYASIFAKRHFLRSGARKVEALFKA